MRHSLNYQTLGGWGKVFPPAFAYDLSKSAAWDKARRIGVQRYGKFGNNSDTRPVAPEFRTSFYEAWNQKASYFALAGSLDDVHNLTAPFGGAAGISHENTDRENPHAFAIPSALAPNESFAFRAFVHEADGDGEEVKGHIFHVALGDAGQGILFQIRDGRPEIASLSPAWTREQEDTLRLLWALSEPTPTEEAEIAALIKTIYSTFESLSFENTTGRDKWRGELIEVALIPAPDGSIHIALGGGGDVVAVPLVDALATTGLTTLWQGDIEVGGTGGAWIFQALQVRFTSTATMEFGPFFEGPWRDSWGDASYTVQAYTTGLNGSAPAANVSFEREEVGSASFKFKATFTTTDTRYGAWLYSLSSRIEGGVREGLEYDTVSYDSANVLGGDGQPSNPIMEASIHMDEGGKRGGTIVQRDIAGATSAQMAGGSFNGFLGRVCNLTHANYGAIFTQAIVVDARLEDARSYGAIYSAHSKGETVIENSVCDGWQILDETLNNPPVIGDGLRLGEKFRRYLRQAGYSSGEMSLVPSNFGPLIQKARIGDDWANVGDAGGSITSAIEADLDRYGDGLRFYQNSAGVWVLERVPATIVAEFTSSAAANHGSGDIILNPLSWQRDNENYYNKFTVTGGSEDKPITRTWYDERSLVLGSGGVAGPYWLGREREYPALVDFGLGTVGGVDFGLRSLVYRRSKPGRYAQFETYFTRQYKPRDRVQVDGVLCEVETWDASAAEDKMQIRVREVL